MYHSVHDAGQFPRLFFTSSDLPTIRSRLEHPDCCNLWARLLAACEGMLEDEPRALFKRHIRASHMAFAFLVTGRSEFAEKAVAMALELASREPAIAPVEVKRGARVGLATGFIVTEMSLVYDWLHDQLSPVQRADLVHAIKIHGFDPAVLDFREEVRGYDYYTCNGMNVVHGPILMAAILLEDAIDTSEAYAMALTQTKRAIAAHCMDGGYPEGILYWNYSTRHMLLGVEALRRLKGIDLYNEPFLRNTGDYALHFILPWLTQCANTADSFQSTHPWAPVAALASRHRRTDWQWLAQRLIRHDWGEDGEALEYSLFFLIFYDPSLEAALPDFEQRNWLFSGLQQLSWRSDWSEDAIHLLWLNGPSNCHHNHLHLNSFTLSAFGERLLIEMGKFDYSNNLDYRKATAGHNSLLVNGEGQIITTDTNIFCRRIRAGQWGTVYGEFRCLREEAGATIATGSIVNAYKGRLRNYDRTLAFIERQFIFLHDFVELDGEPPALLSWLFHAGGELELQTGGAIFATGEARMHMHLVCAEPLQFEVRDDHTGLDGGEKPVPYLVVNAVAREAKTDLFALLVPHRAGEAPHFSLGVGADGSSESGKLKIRVGNSEFCYNVEARALSI